MTRTVGSLATKRRPQTFDEVVGQDPAVRMLRRAVDKRDAVAFLLSGPSGVGKTTLARVTASSLGCRPADLEEIDGATHTGVEEMRGVTSQLLYRPLGEGSVKALIVDECQRLSKNAWDSLLKILEEPPNWVYWFLCTTEPTKIPTTIKTRCLPCELKPVATQVIEELLLDVLEAEGEELEVDPDQLARACAREAGGSPRQALSNLSACMSARSMTDVRELLRSAEDSPEAVELARLLVKGARWEEAQQLLATMKDVSPESLRHVVRAYVSKVVLGAKSNDAAGRGLEILDAFSEPFHPSDGMAPVLVACGRLLL